MSEDMLETISDLISLAEELTIVINNMDKENSEIFLETQAFKEYRNAKNSNQERLIKAQEIVEYHSNRT
jgi:ABC-type phosphate/phosphonate transport system substrate-binding protein